MFCCSARKLRLLAAASILLASGLRVEHTPSPTDIERAVITVNTDPNPIPAVASTRVGTAFSARFKVVIKEIAGQGGEVQAVNSTLYDELSGAIVGLVNYDTSDLLVFVGAEAGRGQRHPRGAHPDRLRDSERPHAQGGAAARARQPEGRPRKQRHLVGRS